MRISDKAKASIDNELRALIAERDKYRELVEFTSDWLWEVDEQLLYSYSSPRAYDFLGYQPQEILGKSPFEFMIDKEADRIKLLLKDNIERKTPFNAMRNVNIHKLGFEVVLETSAVPIYDKDGNFKGWRGIDRDISLKEKIDKENRREQEQIQALFERSNEGWLIVDANGLILNCNAAFADLLGYSIDELKEIKTFWELTPEKWLKENRRFIELIIDKKEMQTYEKEYIHKSGRHIPINIRTFAVFDSVNEVQYMCGIVSDLSEIKRINAALEESKDELEKFYRRIQIATAASGVGIWEFDFIQKRFWVDDNVCKIFGCLPEAFPHEISEWKKTIFPEDLDSVEELYRSAECSKGDFVGEFRIVRPDGELRYVHMHGQILSNQREKVKVAQGVQIDVTDTRRLEENLLHIKEELQRAIVMKNMLLSSLGHELRTPVSAILGFVQLLRGTAPDQIQGNYINKIVELAERLLSLINETISLSKIETGNLELNLEPTYISDVIDNCLEIFRLEALKKGIELRKETVQYIPEVLCDKMRISQVIINLLSNALKFTVQGSIVIKVELTKIVNDNAYIKVAVKDTGIGINDDRKETLFVPYTKQGQEARKRFGGTGLGLAICKNIVSLFNGYIDFVGRENEGSEFFFEIQCRLTDNSANGRDYEKAAKQYSVLLIENNDIDRMIVTAKLEAENFVVIETNNIDKAVEIASEQPQIECVLVDYKFVQQGIAKHVNKIKELVTKRNIVIVVYGDAVEDKQTIVKQDLPSIDLILNRPIDAEKIRNVMEKANG